MPRRPKEIYVPIPRGSQLSNFFLTTFFPDDVSLIATRIIQLRKQGKQQGIYKWACIQCNKVKFLHGKPCNVYYNFQPGTRPPRWLGSKNNNCVYGRLKKKVFDLEQKLRRQELERAVGEKENQLVMARKSEESFRRQLGSLSSKNTVCEKKLAKCISKSNSRRRKLNDTTRKLDESEQVIVSTHVHL